MDLNNKYGYKICYKEIGNTKYKVYLVTNSFDLAIWELRWYENHTQKDRIDKHKIINALWQIFEVKTLKEYEKLWKDCPFKDSFSN